MPDRPQATLASPARILLVDDEEAMCFMMKAFLKKASPPYEAVAVNSGEEALERLQTEHFDVVVTDLNMPGMSGAELIEKAKALNPATPIIAVTSFGTSETKGEVMTRGAFQYIERPFKESAFLLHIERALETLSLKREVATLRTRVERDDALRQVRGNSRAIEQVKEILPTIAKNEASVIIYGESGTGKELFARAIHDLSPRVRGPFVTLNCGALPETLLENELFGHMKGAYSDATSDQPGLAREADQGSLFLDEIGEIGLAIQVKLLRFLQEREYRPLGSTKTIKSNVRIIAATNRDLREAIVQGTFREDLYYRLNIIPIHLPPLRNRREDIPILANFFLQKYASLYGRRLDRFTPEALQKLMNYPWPGNIRELENKIQQILVIAPEGAVGPDQIGFDELPGGTRAVSLDMAVADPLDGVDFGQPFAIAKQRLIERFEKRYLTEALAANRGNVSSAARRSGKDRRAFFELLRKHSIDPKPYRKGGASAPPEPAHGTD
ncbi:MAG: sigma-54-dependent Fis family transcriptional regulator [Candidatus Wallbacteria bacterium]|nr:sigma-54-dependent Fis family transcriptional regulator [Candidatus Wallbacteria bacterium]